METLPLGFPGLAAQCFQGSADKVNHASMQTSGKANKLDTHKDIRTASTEWGKEHPFYTLLIIAQFAAGGYLPDGLDRRAAWSYHNLSGTRWEFINRTCAAIISSPQTTRVIFFPFFLFK